MTIFKDKKAINLTVKHTHKIKKARKSINFAAPF